MAPQLIGSIVLFALLVLGAGLMLLDANALRDDSTLHHKPYSLARVQLWWWTVLILGSWILAYGLTKQLWPLNGTCLALLGISAMTTSAGRIIDNRDDLQGVARHQDDKSDDKPRNIFVDILSDERGVSVHRFQSVVFSIAYGVAFVIEVFTRLDTHKFWEFDATTMALLGLSSGTYVTIKAVENQPSTQVATRPQAASRPRPQSDELIDPDEASQEIAAN